MRNKECDTYMEKRFGKPLFKKSFVHEGLLLTPFQGQKHLFRQDPLPASRRR